ncbi:MAG: hypothetical protein ACRDT4_10555 [Micromonosporaceae bacterium]
MRGEQQSRVLTGGAAGGDPDQRLAVGVRAVGEIGAELIPSGRRRLGDRRRQAEMGVVDGGLLEAGSDQLRVDRSGQRGFEQDAPGDGGIAVQADDAPSRQDRVGYQWTP